MHFEVIESTCGSRTADPGRGRARPVARGVALTFGLIALWFAAPPAGFAAPPPGPWDSPPRPLSLPVGTTSPPDVAVGPEGTTVVYWRQQLAADFLFLARVRPPAGTFGPTETISAAGEDATQLRVAVGPDGVIRAVWASFDGVTAVLKNRSWSPGGALGPIENLSSPSSGFGSAGISVAPDGTTTTTWNQSTGPHSIVRARTMPPGGSFGPEVPLSEPGESSGFSRVVDAPDGTTTVIWRRNDGPNRKIQTVTRPPGGSFGPVEDLGFAASASEPALAVGTDGTVAAGWFRPDGLNGIPQVATRPPGGGFGPAEDLSAPSQFVGDPRLAIGPGGTTTAVWTRWDGAHHIAQTRTRPPGGSFGATTDLSQGGASAQFPAIGVGPDGSETVIWERFDGANARVEARTRLPGGTFGPTQLISLAGQSSSFPDLAVGADGRATAVWRRSSVINDYISTLPPEFTLAAFVPKRSRGRVTSGPAGIDCGATCLAGYSSYTRVTLTATATAGNRFTGWKGACSGSDPTCEVIMDEARSVSADFEAGPVCPPRKLKAGKLRRNRKNGTGKLKVNAGGKGKVVLKPSKRVRKSVTKVGESGKGRVKVKARGKAAKKLRRKGRVRIRVKLVYRPGADCRVRTKTRKVKLVRNRR